MSKQNKIIITNLVESFELDTYASELATTTTLREFTETTERKWSSKEGTDITKIVAGFAQLPIDEKIAKLGVMWKASQNISKMLKLDVKTSASKTEVEKYYGITPEQRQILSVRYANGLRSLNSAIKQLYVDVTREEQKANGIKGSKEAIAKDVSKNPKKLDQFKKDTLEQTTESFKKTVERHSQEIAESKKSGKSQFTY